MVYTLGMKYIFIVIIGLFLASCTFHIKGKELDIQGKPAEPGVKWTQQTYELESIDILKKGS